MIPNPRWFPTNLAARAAWMDNFTTQFVTTYAALLGLSSSTSTVTNDNNCFQSVAQSRLAASNFDRAVGDYLRDLTEGDPGSPEPTFPSESFAPPAHPQPAGMFQRLDDLRRLIMAQPNYNEAMGTAMGIESSGGGGQGIAPGDVQPDISVHAAAVGYLFSVVVSKRHGSDAWQVWTAKAGTADWQIMTTATGKSTDVVYPQGEEPGPIQIQVRVQLRKNNANYGNPSDISLVTVNP